MTVRTKVSPGRCSSTVKVDGHVHLEVKLSQLSIDAVRRNDSASATNSASSCGSLSRPSGMAGDSSSVRVEPDILRIRDCIHCRSRYSRPPPGGLYPDIRDLPCQCQEPSVASQRSMYGESVSAPIRGPSPRTLDNTPSRRTRCKGKQVDRPIKCEIPAPRPFLVPSVHARSSSASSHEAKPSIPRPPVKREARPSSPRPSSAATPSRVRRGRPGPPSSVSQVRRHCTYILVFPPYSAHSHP